MKKIIYSLLIALATTFAFSSCTEEDIKPKTDAASNGGGGGNVGTDF